LPQRQHPNHAPAADATYAVLHATHTAQQPFQQLIKQLFKPVVRKRLVQREPGRQPLEFAPGRRGLGQFRSGRRVRYCRLTIPARGQ